MPIGGLMWRLRTAAILVSCTISTWAAPPSLDSQLWSELDATYPIATDLSATAIVTARLARELPNPALSAGGLQLDYRHGSWTASGTVYYVSIRNALTGARTGIWLPAAALTYDIGLGAIALSDRNRFEQLEGVADSPVRYRNRVSADWRLPVGDSLTDIFVADEVFYDFSRSRWTRNRAQAGFLLDLTANTRLQTFYMRQSNSYGAPRELNVLGLSLQLVIR